MFFRAASGEAKLSFAPPPTREDPPMGMRYGQGLQTPAGFAGAARGGPMVRLGVDATPTTMDKVKSWFNKTTLNIPRYAWAGGLLMLLGIGYAYSAGWF